MRGRGGDSRNPRLEREAERWRERRLTEGFSLGEAFNQLPSRETGETGRLRFSIHIKCAAVGLVQKHSIFCHIFVSPCTYLRGEISFSVSVGRPQKRKRFLTPPFPHKTPKEKFPHIQTNRISCLSLCGRSGKTKHPSQSSISRKRKTLQLFRDQKFGATANAFADI